MTNHQFFKPSLIAVAISLAFPAAVASADEVADLISPNVAEAAVTVRNVNTVNPLYREYSGVDHKGVNGSLDINFVNRSLDGRWMKMEGHDLGLSTQEFKAGIEQQGDWAVGVGYNQIPHYGPYEIDTRVTGIGGNTLNLPATMGLSEQNLKTERTATSLTAKKFIDDNLVMNFSFKNEDKKGERLMGANGNNAVGGFVGMLFTPEPIDSTHQQFGASLDYVTKKFQVSASYYGSFFKNNAGNALFVNYGTVGTNNVVSAATPTAMSPLSLAPDNHSQEFSVSGGYNFSDDTRGTLKVAKTFGVQDASFMSIPFGNTYGTTRLTSRSNLGGEVETTNVAAAFTSSLTRELSVLASWAYEDLNDKTPLDLYLYDHGSSTAPVYNNPQSQKTNRGKFEATYRLPLGYAVMAGYDYDQKKYPGMDELFRSEVTEQTYRLDLRKSMSETLNGSIRLAHSNRTGSDWAARTPDTNGNAWILPTQFSDRQRDKARLMLDWLPTEALSMQFAFEHSEDNYATRVNNSGLQKGKADLYSLDAVYRFSEKWKTSLWYSYGTNDIDQSSLMASYGRTCLGYTPPTSIASNVCVPWQAALNLKTDSFGAGVDGKITGRIDVGAKVSYSHDVNRYNISADQARYAASNFAPGAGVLPDTVHKQTNMHMFGKYTLSKATTLRLDYIWDKREMDDYTWSNWTYSDGTKVFVKPNQITQIVGVTVIQSF